MISLILQTAARFLLPLLLIFSLFLLLRGHDEPGGGFIAGLVAAGAFSLYAFAFDIPTARQALRVDPVLLVGFGLTLAIVAGLPGPLFDEPFFTGQWMTLDLPGFGELKLSTVLVFDIGVYLTVVGSALTIILSLAEAEE